MKPLSKHLGFFLLLILLPPPASWSVSAPPGQVLAQNDQESLERWQRMTPQEKQELRDRTWPGGEIGRAHV